MLPVIAGMAGLGLAKGLMDKQQEKVDRKQSAEMARWSPWSGMAPNEIQRANVLGSTMQGGMSGAMMGNLGGAAGGGAAAAAPAEGAGAMQMTDPAAQASMSGGQSVDPNIVNSDVNYYPGTQTYNQQMAAKYPWLGVK